MPASTVRRYKHGIAETRFDAPRRATCPATTQPYDTRDSSASGATPGPRYNLNWEKTPGSNTTAPA